MLLLCLRIVWPNISLNYYFITHVEVLNSNTKEKEFCTQICVPISFSRNNIITCHDWLQTVADAREVRTARGNKNRLKRCPASHVWDSQCLLSFIREEKWRYYLWNSFQFTESFEERKKFSSSILFHWNMIESLNSTQKIKKLFIYMR